MRKRTLWSSALLVAVVGLVTVLVVSAVTPPMLTVDTGADQATQAGQDTVRAGAAPVGQAQAASAQAGQAQERQARACNYQSLYNRTIDSLALIRTGDGLGSGFVYNASAENVMAGQNNTTYVITNQHVVNETSLVLVKFSRGETVKGRVVGTSALADLAVIRVKDAPAYAEPLPINEQLPDPGQRVAALGAPFGLERTITSGIVSGVGRSIPTQGGFALPTTIQTDAPINPGNSGGPLVACPSGEVIGVNRAGGAENIGFAVSSAIVQRVVPELIATGDYDFAMLGIGAVEVTPPVARVNDLNTTRGVLVTSTTQGVPAADKLEESDRFASVSGVRIPVGGDVILAVENRSVETPSDIARFLALEGSPGETVQLTILRDGQRRTVNVTLVEHPEPRDV